MVNQSNVFKSPENAFSADLSEDFSWTDIQGMDTVQNYNLFMKKIQRKESKFQDFEKKEIILRKKDLDNDLTDTDTEQSINLFELENFLQPLNPLQMAKKVEQVNSSSNFDCNNNSELSTISSNDINGSKRYHKMDKFTEYRNFTKFESLIYEKSFRKYNAEINSIQETYRKYLSAIKRKNKTSKLKNKEKSSCDTCGKSFNSTNGLQLHISIMHNSNKPLDCKICGKSFSHQNPLRLHMRIHAHLNLKSSNIINHKRKLV